MPNNSLIVRQLQNRYPEVYHDIMSSIVESSDINLDAVFEKFCALKQCERKQVASNKDGLRTLFLACLIKMYDPDAVKQNIRLRKYLLTDVAMLLNVSHEMIKQVSCNVKGLLRAHKPFIREVDLIIEGIKEDGNEERE
jgi:hypothetical protein